MYGSICYVPRQFYIIARICQHTFHAAGLKPYGYGHQRYAFGTLTAQTYIYTRFNSNKSPTRCNNFPVYYPDVYLQLNMFRAFSCPLSGAQWLQWQPLVLQFLVSACLVKPDDCYCLVQFSVDVFVCVYLTCLFGIYKSKVCKSVHHRTIQINHQSDATIFRFIILTVI